MLSKMKCWEFFRCNEEECPVFKLKELRCWLIPGTHCRNEIQGKFLEKMEMCLQCEPFKQNIAFASLEDTLGVVVEQFAEFSSIVEERDKELESLGMEMALGLSEVFEALKKISSGNPEVRVPELSEVELIAKLKHMVNLTAENLGEIVNLSHEFAIGLAEHFDVLHRVSKGELGARVCGISEVELLESLKTVTNKMIEGVYTEIAERRRAEEALRERDKELESLGMEMALGLSEVFEALKKISSGNPEVRVPELSEVELIAKLKHMVNLTAENLGEIVNLSHEFAIGLAEHFDVLHRVSKGDLDARVCGISEVELLESLKTVTNKMIESVYTEIAERKRAEEALQKAHHGLETRVEQRTSELTKANVLLKREIAERRRAEEALVRAKEDWENTFDAITDMVMLLDNEHQVLRVNRAAAEALKTTKEGLVGKKCYEAVHERSHPIRRCPLVLTMKTLEAHTVEITEPNLGGTFLCSTSPMMNREGNLAGYTHTLKDITESKHLEGQFQQAQKMEAVGTLAGGIAHDFNNLLMGIQGNVSLMLMDMDSTHPHHERLRRVEKQLQSGARLTSHLLGYARKGRYEIKPIDPNQLAQEASEAFGRTRKEITIHRDFAEDVFAVEADQIQIEQVLLNLFVNASDAMPGGGDLFLKTMNVTHEDMTGKLYKPKRGDYVMLTVTDSGTGMDKETMGRVFDPFFTTKEMGRGTGLGLASAYGIIKGHGGYIDVDSQKGRGTTFSVYLPASKRRVQNVVETADRFVKGTGTVLLVDDEEVILEVGQDLLEAMGYHVLIAKEGKQAVEVYRKNLANIDIVILDMVMPNIGGGEAYDRMKEINRDVKVLLSTGYSLDGEATEILQRGCHGFIQKPFNMHELSHKMREILDKK